MTEQQNPTTITVILGLGELANKLNDKGNAMTEEAIQSEGKIGPFTKTTDKHLFEIKKIIEEGVSKIFDTSEKSEAMMAKEVIRRLIQDIIKD